MRLLTHNFLKCNRLDCKTGYPLTIQLDDSRSDKVELLNQEVNKEFVQNVLHKIDYKVLQETAEQFNKSLNEELTGDILEDDDFLKRVHDVLFNVNIKEGVLICPKCNTCFPIKDGIPNMLDDGDEKETLGLI